MNKLFIIWPILLLVNLSFCIFALLLYHYNATDEFYKIQLNDISDSACRAAMKTIQLEGDVDVLGNVEIDPEIPWTMYKNVFATSINRDTESVQNAAPAVLLGTNNGYYIHLFDTEHSETTFTSKLPYTYLDNNRYIIDTLNGENILSYAPNGNSKLYTNNGGSLHRPELIANKFIDAVNYMLSVNAHGDWNSEKYYIPETLRQQIQYPVTSFKGITFMVVLENYPLFPGHNISLHTVSNSQLTFAEATVCYMRNNKKYYATYSDIEKELEDKKLVVDCVVTSRSKAALKGYNPDPIYMKFK